MLNSQKYCVLLIMVFAIFTCDAKTDNKALSKLINKSWYSGQENCKENSSPTFETYQYDENTFILRQNKCVHYEAPFIYLLIGKQRALLIDTGATMDTENMSLARAVQKQITLRAQHLKLPKKSMPLLIAHSHSHSDHIAGDHQFTHIENTQIIKPNDTKAIIEAFAFEDWPNKYTTISLGQRKISILASPGHQEQAITLYDHQTQLLFTGDTIYPGRLYVRNWQDYKGSIQRIVRFTENHPVVGMLGAHIEISKTPNVDYPIESTYQPDEASLVLKATDLKRLNSALHRLGDRPTLTNLGNMIIYPLK